MGDTVEEDTMCPAYPAIMWYAHVSGPFEHKCARVRRRAKYATLVSKFVKGYIAAQAVSVAVSGVAEKDREPIELLDADDLRFITYNPPCGGLAPTVHAI